MQGEVYVTVEANETGAQGRALVSGDNGRILEVSWTYPGEVSGNGWPFGEPDESSTVETINNALMWDILRNSLNYTVGQYSGCAWWQS